MIIEGPLIAELRGSYGLESTICTLKWLPWSSSMWVDLLDDILQLIHALNRHCRATMKCINTIEIYLIRLHDLVGEKFHVRNDGDGLPELSIYAGRGMRSSALHLHQFGRKGGEMPVRLDYVGRTYLRIHPIFSSMIR